MGGLAERLSRVRARIARASQAVGRDPSDVTLVAVSKRHPIELIREAMKHGQTVFGENYAQELIDKAVHLEGAKWHFIGHLQRNKVRHVVPTGAVIETVDGVRLVRELDKRAGAPIDVLVQVNVAGERSKSGCTPQELPALLDAAAMTERVRVRGLMTVPPAGEDPRGWFRALRRLAVEHELSELSMGMSGDLEAAIEEGATIVRVGTAIFGPRPD